MLGDCPSALSAYYHNHVGEADTGVYRLRDVGVTASGMMVRDGVLLASNHLGHSVEYCRSQVASGRLLPSATYAHRTVDRAVLLLGGGYDVYGHWLVDIMPKLFALQQAGLDCTGLTYLVPSDMQGFGHSWLEIVGIRPGQLLTYDPLGEIVTAHELIVPVLLRSGSRASRLFRGAVDFLIDAIDRHQGGRPAEDAPPAHLFISRARANRDGRAMRNREEIEHLAVGEGYTVVYPERLALGEQIALFRSARRIVGEYGSGLHASIFSPAGAIVCGLRGAARHPGFLQSGLAQALGQECGYVLGPVPFLETRFQFDIEAAALRQALMLMSLPAG